jgi:hypothetical protein
MHQRNLTNGMMVLGTIGDTIFVRLPPELQTPSLPGTPCRCPYCAAHPDETPMWDTLAVPTAGDRHTATVHMPDPSVLRR